MRPAYVLLVNICAEMSDFYEAEMALAAAREAFGDNKDFMKLEKVVKKKKREAKEIEKEMAKRMIASSAKSGSGCKEGGGATASVQTKTLGERWSELNLAAQVGYTIAALLVCGLLCLLVGEWGEKEL